MSGKGGKAHGPGPRSYEALRWLARLDVAGVEPLGLAMGFGRRATYSHLARLVDAGLVIRAYDRGGSVIAITPAGRRAIGVTRASVPVGALHGLGLQHARAVSWVAARLTIHERDWVAGRTLRRDRSWRFDIVWRVTRDGHFPALGILLSSTRVAIEVELWHRSPHRLRATLAGYEDAIAAGRLGGVIYVSDRPDVLAAVERSASRVGLAGTELRLRQLSDLQANARRPAVE